MRLGLPAYYSPAHNKFHFRNKLCEFPEHLRYQPLSLLNLPYHMLRYEVLCQEFLTSRCRASKPRRFALEPNDRPIPGFFHMHYGNGLLRKQLPLHRALAEHIVLWPICYFMTSFEAGETLRIPLSPVLCYRGVQTIASLSGSLT